MAGSAQCGTRLAPLVRRRPGWCPARAVSPQPCPGLARRATACVHRLSCTPRAAPAPACHAELEARAAELARRAEAQRAEVAAAAAGAAERDAAAANALREAEAALRQARERDNRCGLWEEGLAVLEF